jgi:hypothetical protein
MGDIDDRERETLFKAMKKSESMESVASLRSFGSMGTSALRAAVAEEKERPKWAFCAADEPIFEECTNMMIEFDAVIDEDFARIKAHVDAEVTYCTKHVNSLVEDMQDIASRNSNGRTFSKNMEEGLTSLVGEDPSVLTKKHVFMEVCWLLLHC